MKKIGNRPNFPLNNQRFDKGDATDIYEVFEDTLTQVVGAVFGQTWGCLSRLQWTWRSADNHIEFGKMTFLAVLPDGATAPDLQDTVSPELRGPIVQHDPASPAQASSDLDMSALVAQKCWLLFRRAEAETDSANKAFWDTSATAEDIGTANMRVRTRVEFAAVTTAGWDSAYSPTNGWFPFAYVSAWGAFGPTVVPIHWTESAYFNINGPPPTGAAHQSALVGAADVSGLANRPAGTQGFNPSLDMPSMTKLLRWALLKLGQHMSPAQNVELIHSGQIPGMTGGGFHSADAGATSWLQPPPRGLVELHTALEAAEAVTSAISDNISRMFRAYGKVGSYLGSASWNPSTGTWTYHKPSIHIQGADFGGGASRFWRLDVAPIVAAVPAGFVETSGDTVLPYQYGPLTLRSFVVQDHHPTGNWDSDGPNAWTETSVGRKCETSPSFQLPHTIPVEDMWQVKIRFRRVDNGDLSTSPPAGGFTVTFFGDYP